MAQTTHATQARFARTINLCDDARRHLAEQAGLTSLRSGFSPRQFAGVGVTCTDCLAVMALGPTALPAPVVVQTPAPRNPLGAQIQASMRERYGEWITREDWETER